MSFKSCIKIISHCVRFVKKGPTPKGCTIDSSRVNISTIMSLIRKSVRLTDRQSKKRRIAEDLPVSSPHNYWYISSKQSTKQVVFNYIEMLQKNYSKALLRESSPNDYLIPWMRNKKKITAKRFGNCEASNFVTRHQNFHDKCY